MSHECLNNRSSFKMQTRNEFRKAFDAVFSIAFESIRFSFELISDELKIQINYFK